MKGALNYEVARLRTLRSTWWLLTISLVVTAAIATAIALVARNNDLDIQYLAVSLTGGADFSPIPLPAVFAGLVGVFAFGHEYRYGTIRPALAAVPHRTTLLASKLVITSLWAVVIAVLNVGMGFLVLVIVPGQDLRAFGLPWAAVGRPIAGFVLLVLLWNVVGLAFGGLFRNMPAAIVCLLVIPLMVENILFAVLQFVPALDDVSWLANYLPFTAGAAMATVFTPSDFDQGSDIDVPTALQGGITFAIFAFVLIALCLALFRRRDA